MSFDEKQQVDNDEIDLAQLFKSIGFINLAYYLYCVFGSDIHNVFSSALRAHIYRQKPFSENPKTITRKAVLRY